MWTNEADQFLLPQPRRVLIGTWVSVELENALKLGYEIQQLYQVWHFKESRVGLFKEYVQMFLN